MDKSNIINTLINKGTCDNDMLVYLIKIDNSLIRNIYDDRLLDILEQVPDIFLKEYNIDEDNENVLDVYKQLIIDGFTNENYLKAIKKNWRVISFLSFISKEVEMAAVKESYLALKYIKNQSFDICLEAIKQNYLAMQYINIELTEFGLEKINLERVKQNPNILKELTRSQQTDKICCEALDKDGMLLEYVYNKERYICSTAIKQNGNAIKFINKSINNSLKFLCELASFDKIHKPPLKIFPYIDEIIYERVCKFDSNALSTLIEKFPYNECYFSYLSSYIDITPPGMKINKRAMLHLCLKSIDRLISFIKTNHKFVELLDEEAKNVFIEEYVENKRNELIYLI